MTRESEATVYEPSVFVVFEDDDLDAFARGVDVAVETEEHGTIVFTSGWGTFGDYSPTVTTPSDRHGESTLARLEDGKVVSWSPTPTDMSEKRERLSILAAVEGWFNR